MRGRVDTDAANGIIELAVANVPAAITCCVCSHLIANRDDTKLVGVDCGAVCDWHQPVPDHKRYALITIVLESYLFAIARDEGHYQQIGPADVHLDAIVDTESTASVHTDISDRPDTDRYRGRDSGTLSIDVDASATI